MWHKYVAAYKARPALQSLPLSLRHQVYPSQSQRLTVQYAALTFQAAPSAHVTGHRPESWYNTIPHKYYGCLGAKMWISLLVRLKTRDQAWRVCVRPGSSRRRLARARNETEVPWQARVKGMKIRRLPYWYRCHYYVVHNKLQRLWIGTTLGYLSVRHEAPSCSPWPRMICLSRAIAPPPAHSSSTPSTRRQYRSKGCKILPIIRLVSGQYNYKNWVPQPAVPTTVGIVIMLTTMTT